VTDSWSLFAELGAELDVTSVDSRTGFVLAGDRASRPRQPGAASGNARSAVGGSSSPSASYVASEDPTGPSEAERIGAFVGLEPLFSIEPSR
jgi:hypothetical protein